MQIFLSAIAPPHSAINSTAGSPLWQMVFVSFSVVLILFEILRGWRRGIARQLARLGALIAAYFAAFFGGKFIVPLLRPFLKMPDVIISILAGAVLALVVYAIINSLGTILFSRTHQHGSIFMRLLYGLGGGVFGLFFGALLVWVVVVGVRSLGSVADAQVREQAAASATGTEPRAIHAVDVRRRLLSESNEETPSLMTSLARLKNSLEMGVIGDVVRKADVIPSKTYDALGKIGQVASSPQSAERFLSFPGARELSDHPKIVALRNDPEISEMIAQGRYVELLRNEKITDAANDAQLVELSKKFDLNGALDYALQKQ